MKSNIKTQKTTPARHSRPRTAFERLNTRRPSSKAANIWWCNLLPIEKGFYHWFVRAAQVATDREAQIAIKEFRGIDKSMLHFMRKEKARFLRHQKRLTSTPPKFLLTEQSPQLQVFSENGARQAA